MKWERQRTHECLCLGGAGWHLYVNTAHRQTGVCFETAQFAAEYRHIKPPLTHSGNHPPQLPGHHFPGALACFPPKDRGQRSTKADSASDRKGAPALAWADCPRGFLCWKTHSLARRALCKVWDTLSSKKKKKIPGTSLSCRGSFTNSDYRIKWD